MDLPTTRVTGANIVWDTNYRIFKSPLSGGEQSTKVWGRWVARYEYDLLEQDEALALKAFLERVIETGETFGVLHPLQRNPSSVWSYANGKVNGAGQTGMSLLTDGWPNNTNIFKSGDLVELPSINQVMRIFGDVTSDGSGVALLTFSQLMRSSPADDNSPSQPSLAVALNPKFILKLLKPTLDDLRVPAISTFTIEMAEDI